MNRGEQSLATNRRAHASEPPAVLVVGESLVDIVHREDGIIEHRPGGSPANVALALGRLARNPELVTSFANDDYGALIREWLDFAGINVRNSHAGRTATATAYLDSAGAATYDFDVAWSVDVPDTTADLLHIGSISAVLEPGASTVSELVDTLRGRALVSFDPNIRPQFHGGTDETRSHVESFVTRAHVVKTSDEDLRWLYPGKNIVEVARDWVRSGPGLVVVTRGEHGAIAVSESVEVEVSGKHVDVVDTVGAGDTFMGALLDGLMAINIYGPESPARIRALTGPTVTSLLNRATLAAAINVTRSGANPPTLDELSDAEQNAHTQASAEPGDVDVHDQVADQREKSARKK